PRLAQPDLVAELAHGGDRALGCARDGERALVADGRAQPCQLRPVPVQETAVATARAGAAGLRLDEDDAKGRLAAAPCPRRPAPGVPAADDRDVGVDVARERRLGRIRRRFLPPPRQLAAGKDGGFHRDGDQAVSSAASSSKTATYASTSSSVWATE